MWNNTWGTWELFWPKLLSTLMVPHQTGLMRNNQTIRLAKKTLCIPLLRLRLKLNYDVYPFNLLLVQMEYNVVWTAELLTIHAYSMVKSWTPGKIATPFCCTRKGMRASCRTGDQYCCNRQYTNFCSYLGPTTCNVAGRWKKALPKSERLPPNGRLCWTLFHNGVHLGCHK